MFLDLLFPPICVGCGVLLHERTQPDTPLCGRCGLDHQPLPPWARLRHGVSAVHGYDGPLRRALHRLKFRGEVAWAGPLGASLATSPRWHDPWHAVVPIPLHPERQAKRGYNQSALLARHAAHHHRVHGPPLRPQWLRRQKATEPQHRLPAAERPSNVHQAFVVPQPRKVAGRRVLLVDDVTTTGATLAAARTALLAAGATQVGALALFRALQ